MKLGVSVYSFSKLVKSGAMNYLDVPAKVKEIGFDVIEISTALPVPEGETTLSFAPKLREACDKADIKVTNYCVGADLINGTNGDREAEINRIKNEVRVAKILGCPSMRHDGTGGFRPEYVGPKGFDDALSVLIKGTCAITEFAAEQGIRTMVENHGFFCQDSERLEKLVNGVNHSNFGLLVDMGNFLCADEEPNKAVGRLMPYAFHVHAKDFHVKPGTSPDPGQGWFLSRGGNYLRGAVIGHGDVPIIQCLKIMKKAGYDKVLSMEFEGIEEPINGMTIGLQNLRRYVKEIYG